MNAFDLSKQEKWLIDYAKNISIPQYNGEIEPSLPANEQQLRNYAQIFYEHFSQIWNKQKKYFTIEIYCNGYVVGMEFIVQSTKPVIEINITRNKNTDDLFKQIKLGEDKITDKFIKQRDIRGFNKNSFYVIKSNQLKNWHQAVACGDLAEFVEAMMHADKIGVSTE
ncbi:MAG: hypothetical protein KAS17_00800, partial [Victivallaceae bacterium]|nr:hypothetical protein [Victivallaceae bacterium]